MSEGEIEVEAVSGYEVLPKEVVAEIGSIKLFSTFFAQIRDAHPWRGVHTGRHKNWNFLLTALTNLQTDGATRMSRSVISP